MDRESQCHWICNPMPKTPIATTNRYRHWKVCCLPYASSDMWWNNKNRKVLQKVWVIAAIPQTRPSGFFNHHHDNNKGGWRRAKRLLGLRQGDAARSGQGQSWRGWKIGFFSPGALGFFVVKSITVVWVGVLFGSNSLSCGYNKVAYLTSILSLSEHARCVICVIKYSNMILSVTNFHEMNVKHCKRANKHQGMRKRKGDSKTSVL